MALLVTVASRARPAFSPFAAASFAAATLRPLAASRGASVAAAVAAVATHAVVPCNAASTAAAAGTAAPAPGNSNAKDGAWRRTATSTRTWLGATALNHATFNTWSRRPVAGAAAAATLQTRAFHGYAATGQVEGFGAYTHTHAYVVGHVSWVLAT